MKEVGYADKERFIFRRASAGDVPAICRILSDAVERMLAEGKRQWDRNYPSESDVVGDIASGCAYVLDSGGEVVAYGAVVFTGEPVYENLDGEWLSDEKYVVVHRLAVAKECRGRGVGGRFLKAVEFFASDMGVRSFKIDTNYDNFYMLRLLERCGFTYCGEVHYAKGDRKAFEKLI